VDRNRSGIPCLKRISDEVKSQQRIATKQNILSTREEQNMMLIEQESDEDITNRRDSIHKIHLAKYSSSNDVKGRYITIRRTYTDQSRRPKTNM
jgi:hypothetical protein